MTEQTPSSPKSLQKRALWSFIYFFIGAVVLCSLWWPFGLDQGIFAWVGDEILRGGVPYRDAWDQKGPATHFTFALAQALFGRHMYSIRIVDAILLLSTMTVLFFGLRRSFTPDIAHFTIAWFALCYLGNGFWYTSQSDGWIAMIQALVIAIALPFSHAHPARSMFLAGALLCLAGLFKSPYLVTGIVVLPLAWHIASGSESKPVQLLSAGVAGYAATLLAAVIYFAAYDSLDDVYAVQIAFNSVYAGELDVSPRIHLHKWFARLRSPHVAPLLPLAALGLYATYVKRRTFAVFLLTLGLVDILLIVLQRRYFLYHLLPFYLGLAVLAGAGLAYLFQVAASRSGSSRDSETRSPVWQSHLANTLIVCILCVAVYRPATHLQEWLSMAFGPKTLHEYHDKFGTKGGGHHCVTSIEVGRYLAEHTNPNDMIAMWSFDVSPLYFADRKSATRFGYHYPVVQSLKFPQLNWIKIDFIEAIEASKPKYIVVSKNDVWNSTEKSSDEYIRQDFPFLHNYIMVNYVFETTLGHYDLYSRSDKGV